MSPIGVIAAETHSSEYLLHKYWARKPHNVVAAFIKKLVPQGGVVVDPCCGSGVSIREAQKQNKQAFGFDVNPIACLISSVLVSPPDKDVFERTIQHIMDECSEKISAAYSFRGRPIRYCVHEIIARCPICNTGIKQQEAEKVGKTFKCPLCHNKLHYNLENMTGTVISSVCMDDTGEMCSASDLLEQQTVMSAQNTFTDDTGLFDFPFVENRRILAFGGMSTRRLFTPRNFSILVHLANEFNKIADPNVRDAAKLFLSASVAQCSRLIATRNNLASGGPAWSIPGFWVPAVHMESIPLSPLRARLKKFSKGLAELSITRNECPARIIRQDSRLGLKQLSEDGVKADLVFFDPPYGDNVPYAEFSAMWNSFLRDLPDPNLDISVSDRLEQSAGWIKYAADMNSMIASIRLVMSETSTLLITFNNNDPRAWKALLSALQNNSLVCGFVTYQIPAVVSSKAQKAIEGSYISDIYVGYRLSDAPQYTTDLKPVVTALKKCAVNRGGRLPEALARREAMIAWLRNNVSVSEFDKCDEILGDLFDNEDSLLSLKGFTPISPSPFAESCVSIANSVLGDGPKEWKRLYAAIAAKLAEFGIPDPHEVKAVLKETVTISGNLCSIEAPSLF